MTFSSFAETIGEVTIAYTVICLLGVVTAFCVLPLLDRLDRRKEEKKAKRRDTEAKKAVMQMLDHYPWKEAPTTEENTQAKEALKTILKKGLRG